MSLLGANGKMLSHFIQHQSTMTCRKSVAWKMFETALRSSPAVLELAFKKGFSTSMVPLTNDYSSHSQGKYMQKFFGKRGAKSKRNWYQPHFAEPLEPIGKKSLTQKKGVSQTQLTRARQLGHVLYDKITHIISTGELSQEIQDKQIFIVEVRMHTNFGGINVLWEAQRADAAEVEKLLQSHAGKLRSILISYHVLGKIPPITFVKSKSKNYTAEIDKLFAEADYGPDYVPLDHVTKAERGEEDMVHKDVSNSGSERAMISRESYHKLELNDRAHQSEAVNSSGMEGLNFRNDLYGLPVVDLLNKVRAKKDKGRFAQEKSVPDFESVTDENFTRKMAALGKSKMKLARFKESTKTKQKMLEMGYEDFRLSSNRADPAFDNETDSTLSGESDDGLEDFNEDDKYR